MKKTLKYLVVTALILFNFVLITTLLFPHIDRATQFDVEMTDNGVYFTFKKECKVSDLEIQTISESSPVTMWRIVKRNPYAEDTLKIKRIKYGEHPDKFDIPVGSKKLEKNVKYRAAINSSQGALTGLRDFIITDSNEVQIVTK